MGAPYNYSWDAAFYDHGGHVVNVQNKAFGAVGDGTTDDSTAIQAAIDACLDGGCVVLPMTASGYDLNTTGLTLPTTKAVTLKGYGVQLLYSGTGAAITINNAAGANDPRHVIEGLTLKQDGTTGNGSGIKITDSQFQTVRDCRIVQFGKGVELVNTSYWTEACILDNLEFTNCTYGIHVDDGASAYASFASLTVRDCIVGTMASAASTPYGIYVATGASIYRATFERVVVNPDKNSSVGFYSDGDTSDLNGSVHIENVSGSVTGNVAWQFGANATGGNMSVFSDIRGTIATKLSLAGSIVPLGLVFGNQGAYSPAIVRKAAALSHVRTVMDDDVSTYRMVEQVGSDNLWRWRPKTYADIPEVVSLDNAELMGVRHVLMGTGPVAASDGDGTPSVKGIDFLTLTYTGATNVTAFDDPTNGQRLVLRFGNGNVTLKTGAYLALAGTIDYNAPSGTVMEGIFQGGTWYEISRTEA
jgi:hypothetical protein